LGAFVLFLLLAIILSGLPFFNIRILYNHGILCLSAEPIMRPKYESNAGAWVVSSADDLT
jgi:hypothetical protein